MAGAGDDNDTESLPGLARSSGTDNHDDMEEAYAKDNTTSPLHISIDKTRTLHIESSIAGTSTRRACHTSSAGTETCISGHCRRIKPHGDTRL
jgi:hypothetical protein